MTRDKSKNLDQLLCSSGFSPVDGEKGIYVWRAAMPALPAVSKTVKESKKAEEKTRDSQWQVQEWKIRVVGERWTTVSLRLTAARSVLSEQFQDVVRQYYGAGAIVEVALGKKDDYWFLLEFIKPRSKQIVPLSVTNMEQVFSSPHGLGGFRFSLSLDKDALVINVYDQFAIGYVPPRFFFQFYEIMAEMFGGKWQESRKTATLFEQRYELSDVLRSIIANHASPEQAEQVIAHCQDQAGRAKNKIVQTLESRTDGVTLVVAERGVASGHYRKPALEVLEARELQQQSREIDSLLFDAKWLDAAKLCQRYLENKQHALFALRRLGLLFLSSRIQLSSEALAEGMDTESHSKLFLSCFIRQAQANGGKENEGLLGAVSQLGELLYNDVEDPENLKTLEVVLPEILGDCWFTKDPEMAEACYQRVVTKRGNLPRVLTKLALLARSQGLRQEEITVLRQLLEVERRTPEMANIYLRLAQLHQGVDPDEVVKNGLASLNFLPMNLDAVNLVCDTLLQNGKPTDAIQVLSEALERFTQQKNNAKRADLEIAIGEIWESHLGRRDLARERYTRALSLADNERTYKRLAEIFQQLKAPRQWAEALQGLADIYIAEGRMEAKEVVEELAQLYRFDLQEPERALVLYRQMNKRIPLNPTDIAAILGWVAFETDWAEFYKELIAQPLDGRDQQYKIQFHSQMGEYCQKRLQDNAKAAEHFFAALRAGWLEQDRFSFLCQHYQNQQQWRQLVATLKLRIEQAHPQDQMSLIEKILSHPEQLEDGEANDYTIAVYKAKSDASVLRQRIQYYLNKQDLSGLEKFESRLVAEFSSHAVVWLQEVLTELKKSRQTEKYALAQKHFEWLRELGGDMKESWRQELKWMKQAPRVTWMKAPLIQLLRVDEIPDLDAETVEKVLADDKEILALYYDILSQQTSDREASLHAVQKAWDFYRPLAGHEEAKLRLLLQLAQSSLLNKEEVASLHNLVRPQGLWREYARCLQHQVMMHRQRDDKIALLKLLLVVEWEERQDVAATLEVYQRLAAVAENAPEWLFQMIEFARREANVPEVEQAMAEFFRHPQSIRYPREFQQALRWCISETAGLDELTSIVPSTVEKMLRDNKTADSIACGEILRDYRLANQNITLACLEYYLQKDSRAAIVETFNYGLGTCHGATQASEYLTLCQQLFRRLRHGDLFDFILSQGVETAFSAPLSPQVLSEVKVFYAKTSFDSGRNQELAFKLLEQHYQDQPEDSRIWSTLYFLLKDYGDERRTWVFLQEIIPQLETNSEALRQFSITLEKLKEEKKRIEEALKLKEEPPPVSEVEVDPELAADKEVFEDNVVDFQARRQEAIDAPSSDHLPQVAGGEWSHKENKEFTRSQLKNRRTDLDEEKPAPLKGDAAQFMDDVPPLPPEALAPVENSEFPPEHSYYQSQDSDPYADDYSDWRQWIRRMQVKEHMTRDLMNRAFANELEKHVAIQAFAVLSGEFTALKHWQLKVWREFNVSYPLDAKQRMMRDQGETTLHTDLVRLLILLSKPMSKIYYRQFSAQFLLERFRVSKQQLLAARKMLSYDASIMRHSGLSLYADKFLQQHLKIFHLGPMGDNVFYDVFENAIYLNIEVMGNRPPSHFRHMVLRIYRATRLNYYILLSLNAEKQVLPFLKAVMVALRRKGFDSLMASAGITSDPVEKVLAKIDRERLRSLFTRAEGISLVNIQKTMTAMTNQVYKINFAETLDLIGLIEEAFSADLTRPVPRHVLEAIQRSDMVRALLDLSILLKLE